EGVLERLPSPLPTVPARPATLRASERRSPRVRLAEHRPTVRTGLDRAPPIRGGSGAHAVRTVPRTQGRRGRAADRRGPAGGARSGDGQTRPLAALERAVQVGVEAAGGEELVVATLLDHPTGLEHEDAIRVDDGGQPVGHDEGG